MIWSIIAVMTVNEWLFCTDIKQDYYNKKQFLEWLENELLATLEHVYREKSLVIVLDNCSVHVDSQVEQMIEAHDHLIH